LKLQRPLKAEGIRMEPPTAIEVPRMRVTAQRSLLVTPRKYISGSVVCA
jgi:hypothetical protein